MAAVELNRRLGPQSRRILELLIEGASNKDIACQLGISVRTVKAHLNRMYLLQCIEGAGYKRVRLAVAAYRAQLAASRRENGGR